MIMPKRQNGIHNWIHNNILYWMTFLWLHCNCVALRFAILHLFIDGLSRQFVGCYRSAVELEWKTGFANNGQLRIQMCIDQCRIITTTYAGLQGGRNCFCLDGFDSVSPTDSCNTVCSGIRNEYCGGSDGIFSFYSVCPVGYYGTECNKTCHCKGQIPCDRLNGICPNGCHGNWTGSTCSSIATTDKYIGCYQDGYPNGRALSSGVYDVAAGRSIKDLTLELCFKNCTQSNSTYAGTEYSSECYCGERYDKYGRLSESRCGSRCRGNDGQICGGDNVLSVYSVCPRGNYGIDCNSRCNCKDDTGCTYSNGTCSTGCKPGWTGSSCYIRDCSVSNGDCPINEQCVTFNRMFPSATQCQCRPGYQRNKIWKDCTDLDECGSNVLQVACSMSTETCVDTIGSFSCLCKTGLTRNQFGTCENENERPGYRSSDCNSSTVYCNRSCESAASVTCVVVGLCVGIPLTVIIVVLAISLAIQLRKIRKLEETTKPSRLDKPVTSTEESIHEIRSGNHPQNSKNINSKTPDGCTYDLEGHYEALRNEDPTTANTNQYEELNMSQRPPASKRQTIMPFTN